MQDVAAPKAMPKKTSKHRYFEIRKSPIQGLGAFATRDIPDGARITEYVGERLSNEEVERRYEDRPDRRHHTFLFSVDENTTIDGAVKGNDSKYFNHCCDPNCEAVLEDKRIFIYALRAIPEGEELTYDYQYQVDEIDPSLRHIYVCHCGAKKCRGTILAPAKKSKAKKGAPKGAKKTAPKNSKKGATNDLKSASKKAGAAKRGNTKSSVKGAGPSKPSTSGSTKPAPRTTKNAGTRGKGSATTRR
jgi:hypothetical protein